MTEEEQMEEDKGTVVKPSKVYRDTTVTLTNGAGSTLTLTDAEAREVYSQLRKWYGRAK